MTKIDIKATAREAGFEIHDGMTPWFTGQDDLSALSKFASIVRRAALEEAAQVAGRHFISGHSVAGPKFAANGAAAIRALAQELLECQKR